MKISDLTHNTVTITEKDLCKLVTEFLMTNNLEPCEPIESLNVGLEYVGHGMSEREEACIKDLVIKCKTKVNFNITH